MHLPIKVKQEGTRKDKSYSSGLHYSFKELVLSAIDPNKKVCKSQLKIKDWNRTMMFIGDAISEDENIAIFIDTSRQKELEYKQIS